MKIHLRRIRKYEDQGAPQSTSSATMEPTEAEITPLVT